MKLSKRMIELRKSIADNIDRIDRNVIQSSLIIKTEQQETIYLRPVKHEPSAEFCRACGRCDHGAWTICDRY